MPDPQSPAVDYDKLAAQNGGVDYDAIASKIQAGEAKPENVSSSVWDRLKSAAYQASPLPLFERQNIPTTAGAVAGAATGGLMAVPIAGLTAMAVSGAQGGTPSENLTQGLLNAGGEAAAPLLSAAAPMAGRLMQSALKPAGGRSVLADIRAGLPIPKVVQTLLDEGVSVSQRGVVKLSELLSQQHQATSDVVQSLKGTYPKQEVTEAVLPVIDRFSKQAAPQADLRTIGDVVHDFMAHPVYRNAMTPQELQAMKTATYKELEGQYGQLSSAGIETRKALARGAKEGIETLAAQQGRGDIRAMNAREGRLLEAMEAVVKRVAQTGNTNPLGLAALTHAKTAFLSALIDRSPAVKSMLARGLYQSAGAAAGVSPTLLRSIVLGVAQSSDETPNGP